MKEFRNVQVSIDDDIVNELNGWSKRGWNIINVSEPIKYLEADNRYYLILFDREPIEAVIQDKSSDQKDDVLTPKEKANELGNKFFRGNIFDYSKEDHIKEQIAAKVQAVLCAEVVIESLHKNNKVIIQYWEEVIEEIKNL